MKKSPKINIKGDALTISKSRLKRAQQLVRMHVKPGVSLADELIAERRKAARNE